VTSQPMTAPPFVRQDVYQLQPEGAPVHPIIRAYAAAVGELKRNAGASPHRHWLHHTQVHGMNPDPGDGLRNQCQHFSWYFLPWHRMYIFFFESICRSIIQALPDVDDLTKRTWALPYWDYDKAGQGQLPPAFRDPFINGDPSLPNPLFDAEREPGVNKPVTFAGETAPRLAALTPLQTTAVNWYPAVPYSSPFASASSFGGTETGFHHFREPPPSNGGPIEGAPHGAVHNFVGLRGKMGDFDRAAGDPIFWLHHSNIDRLWEVWRANTGASQDPVASSFTKRAFSFLDEQGSTQQLLCGNVLDTRKLRYLYADISVPTSAVPPRRAQLMARDPSQPPQRIGAVEAPMSVSRGPLASVDIDVENLMDIVRADAQPPSVLLSVDHIDAESMSATMWGVFIEPQGGEPEFIGAMPLFGLLEAKKADAEHGLSYTFDVTDAVLSMLAEGRMDPTRITLSFRPINDIVEGDDAPVSVGTIAVLIQ
jgi:tyrosinase